jgi:6-phosphogluconolactonase
VSCGPGSNGSQPRETEPHVDVLPDAEEATAAAATLLATALAEGAPLGAPALAAAAGERGRADWATTGGTTVIPIYRHLTQSPLRDLVPWGRVHVWWGDDRLVPLDHPLSNRLPFDEVLLGAAGLAGMSGTGAAGVDAHLGSLPGVPIPVSNVHGMPIDEALANAPDDAAARAAAAYSVELRAAPLARDAAGTPILDVVLVGVGPDGHVFSVFPDSPLLDSPALVSAVPAPSHVEPHVARVSLSPRFLGAARLVIVVALGQAKAEVVGRILTGPRDVRSEPAQLARRAGAAWFLDQAAAAALAGRDTAS